MLRQAIDTFLTHHSKKPSSILLTPHAALTLSVTGHRLTGSFDGVPVTCGLLDGSDAVKPGTGSRLGFFVKDTGVQHAVFAVELA